MHESLGRRTIQRQISPATPHVRDVCVAVAGDEAISAHGTNYVIPDGRRPRFIRNPVRC